MDACFHHEIKENMIFLFYFFITQLTFFHTIVQDTVYTEMWSCNYLF